MADPLTILGATAASTQLAVQAVKSFIYLRDLVIKMKAAPEDIQQYTVYLEQLIKVTELFKNNPKLHTTITPILDTCLVQTNKINDLMRSLAIGDTQRWYKKFRVAMKDKDINQMFDRLEREKTSLIVAIAEVDSKLLQSIGLDMAYTKTRTDEVLVVVQHTSHRTEELLDTVKQTAHQRTSNFSDITAILEDIRVNVKSPTGQTAPPRGTTHYLIPNRLVQDFIGREDILTRIKDGFDRPNPQGRPKIVTISGLGGQGKTQLALEHCRRVREQEIKTIFWVDSMSKDLVLASFKKVAGAIAESGQLPEDEHIVQFVREQLTVWPEPWLLIFDNHDDPLAFHLQDYFPGGDQGHILVTSRDAEVANLNRKNAIALDGLPEEEALDLLFAQCEAQRTDSNNQDGKAIVKRLGYHTLAIAQAGSYILLRKHNLDQFLQNFESRKDEILNHTLGMSEYQRQLKPEASETALNVFTTWELSFELLKQSNVNGEHKEDVLTLFAFFDSRDISEALFRTYFEYIDKQHILAMFGMTENWSTKDFESIVSHLAQTSLIQPWFRDIEENCHVSLHPLIRDWIRLRTEYKTFKECTVNTACILKNYLASFEDRSNFQLPLATRLEILYHIDAYLENYKYIESKLSPEDLITTYINLQSSEIWFLKFLGHNTRLTDAEIMAERVSTWRKSQFGLHSAGTLTSLALLAEILENQRNYKKAESLLRQVISGREKLLGAEHRDTTTSLYNLASVLYYQNHLEEAELIHRRVLMIRKKDLGEEHQITANSFNGLAMILSKQGKYEEAEKMNRDVLKVWKKARGNEHPETLICYGNLATILYNQRKYEKAEKMQRWVLGINERVFGVEHQETFRCGNNLASTWSSLGKHKEAENMHRRVLKSREKVLSNEHPDTLSSSSNLALALDDQGRFEEAEKIHRRVLEIRERVLAIDHSETITSVWNLACNLSKQNRESEALKYFERASTLSLKVLGQDHPDTVERMEAYSRCKKSMQVRDGRCLSEEGFINEGASPIGSDEDWETDQGSENDQTRGLEEDMDIYEP